MTHSFQGKVWGDFGKRKREKTAYISLKQSFIQMNACHSFSLFVFLCACKRPFTLYSYRTKVSATGELSQLSPFFTADNLADHYWHIYQPYSYCMFLSDCVRLFMHAIGLWGGCGIFAALSKWQVFHEWVNTFKRKRNILQTWWVLWRRSLPSSSPSHWRLQNLPLSTGCSSSQCCTLQRWCRCHIH